MNQGIAYSSGKCKQVCQKKAVKIRLPNENLLFIQFETSSTTICKNRIKIKNFTDSKLKTIKKN